MKVNFSMHHHLAETPSYANNSDGCVDLVAVSYKETPLYIEFDTGVKVEIPEGYVGLLFPRSSISKKNLHLANSVGVIDVGYSDTIKLRFRLDKNDITTYAVQTYAIGDRVGQLMIIPRPKIELIQVEDIKNGRSGFGSTGN